MAEKYIVFRVEDIQTYLGPQWQEAIAKIQQAITAGRQAQGKRTNHIFLTLNLSDRWAQEAAKHYLRAAANQLDQDPKLANNKALLEIIDAVRDKLTVATLQAPSKLPD